jgi:hypothetical protein
MLAAKATPRSRGTIGKGALTGPCRIDDRPLSSMHAITIAGPARAMPASKVRSSGPLRRPG